MPGPKEILVKQTLRPFLPVIAFLALVGIASAAAPYAIRSRSLWRQFSKAETVGEKLQAMNSTASLKVIDVLDNLGSENWYVTREGNVSQLGTLTVGPTDAIVGVSTNNNATAGNLGESVASVIPLASAVSLATATAANVTSISLTAGDWDVTGCVSFSATSATRTATSAGISTSPGTVPNDGSESYEGIQTTTATEKDSAPIARTRVSITSATTIYLVASATFSAGAVSAFGNLTARRVR